MDEAIRRRLIGAAVLVALAVIFIPIILEGPEEEFGSWSTKIPASPGGNIQGELKSIPLPLRGASEPVAKIVLDSGKQDKEAKKDSSADSGARPKVSVPLPVKSIKEPEKPAVGAAIDKGLRSWVVQVASFRKQANAVQLRDRLRKKGYTAFVEEISGSDGAVYRVRVGPELRLQDAEKQRDRIAKDAKELKVGTPAIRNFP